jgi:lysozyme
MIDLNDPVFGIDVSHHNGKIDWTTVAASGRFQYAIIKATEGRNFLDKRFAENVRGCQAVGIAASAYHFATPDVSRGNQDAVEEAQWFLKVLASVGPLDFPPVLDLEAPKGGVGRPSDLAAYIITFSEVIEAGYGVAPIVYAPNWWLQAQGLLGASFPYKLWQSGYPSPNRGSGDATDPAIEKAKAGQYTYQKTPAWPVAIWQYTDGGVVAGIPNKTDLNVMDGDMFAELTDSWGTATIAGIGLGVLALLGGIGYWLYRQR